MNADRWDEIGTDWLTGVRTPANGMRAWGEHASRVARDIAVILHDSRWPQKVGTLVEVGCGVGRLTPRLAPYFTRVLATDTSAVMLRITSEACRSFPNVEVSSGLYPHGDAALVWGHLYDEDWSDADAIAHITGLLDQFPLVLVETRRDIIPLDAPIINRGHEWLLLNGVRDGLLM